MKQTRFLEPYKENKNGTIKTNLKVLDYNKKQSGVYLIADNEGTVVYVGFSESDLYKTVYRHFQKWTDISREVKTRFTYPKKGYKVRVILTTPARAFLLEKYLIQKLNPIDNGIKYENYLFPQQEKEAQELLTSTIYINNQENPF